MLAETNQLPFPLASEKRGLTDKAGRPGSRRSQESSRCVSGKQGNPAPTHTWHPARLQGRADAAARPWKAAPPMRSRPAPRSAGRGPGPGAVPDSRGGPSRPAQTGQKTTRTLPPEQGAAVTTGFQKSGGPCSDDKTREEDRRAGRDMARGSKLWIQSPVSVLAPLSSSRVTLFGIHVSSWLKVASCCVQSRS